MNCEALPGSGIIVFRLNGAIMRHIYKIMPIMLALCLMLLHTYYAKIYAGIIDSGLFVFVTILYILEFFFTVPSLVICTE